MERKKQKGKRTNSGQGRVLERERESATLAEKKKKTERLDGASYQGMQG